MRWRSEFRACAVAGGFELESDYRKDGIIGKEKSPH
jgi:hypothetical protein